jgi:hypothetical protein
MPTTLTPDREAVIVARVERGARRFGYLLAGAVNAVLLWITHQLLDWGWPGFLTREFEDLLPWITVSFVVSIVVNAVYAWRDAHPVKPIGEMITAAVGFAVAVRTYQVFPFDFSGYDTDWSWLARLVLVLAMIGMVIGFVTHTGKLARGPAGERSSPD